MNRLLERQIKRLLGKDYAASPEYGAPAFSAFLEAISSAYDHFNKEQALLERTLEINSEELNEANRRLLQKNEDISRLATTDALTGLPNRLVCHQRVTDSLNRVKEHGGQFALLFIDLDRFKTINDTLGHEAGDRLLKEVAKRLTDSVRHSDTVSRLSGDEFTVLLEDVSSAEIANVVAQKILDALSRPYEIYGKELNVTASIGIGVYPDNADNIVDIFKYADTAMYFVKENGRNNFKTYDPNMHDRAVKAMEIESSLRSAISNDELSIHYQPILDMESGRIVSCEALLRWTHPKHGPIGPDVFIPIAESSGYITQLGDWVLHHACLQNKKKKKKGLRPIRVAVNISALQFRLPGFIDSVEDTLRDSGLDSENLELEITESTIMDAEGVVMDNLLSLRQRGIKLAIDDFGTGYSSLSKLKHFPIDRLKIDRSFVRDIAVDADDAAIVTAIIAMSNSLNINVVAEGVETTEQLNSLVEGGCMYIQGYWFSRPLPADLFEQLLAKDPFVPREQKRHVTLC